MTYYRLHDQQGTGYMATGYNAQSLGELFADYVSYKANDWDDEMIALWATLSDTQRLEEIGADMFDIEESETPFDPNEIH